MTPKDAYVLFSSRFSGYLTDEEYFTEGFNAALKYAHGIPRPLLEQAKMELEVSSISSSNVLLHLLNAILDDEPTTEPRVDVWAATTEEGEILYSHQSRDLVNRFINDTISERSFVLHLTAMTAVPNRSFTVTDKVKKLQRYTTHDHTIVPDSNGKLLLHREVMETLDE